MTLGGKCGMLARLQVPFYLKTASFWQNLNGVVPKWGGWVGGTQNGFVFPFKQEKEGSIQE